MYPDDSNIFYLDCTRINGTNKIVSRKNESIYDQLVRIKEVLPKQEIFLSDDVVFSGNVLRGIIEMFNMLGVKVVGIISSICAEEAYEYFNKILKYGIKTNFLMENDVIDQVCERDFYFGIAGSGILEETNNGFYKSPYFKPYGNPNERASIPNEYVDYFSKGCLYRSIYIWEEIDKMRNNITIMKELPEKIINTNENDKVVKTLKKEMRRI